MARLITNVLNPFLVSFSIIMVLSFEGAVGTAEAVKWAAISLAISVLPVLMFVIYQVRRKKLNSFFVNHRQQRTVIYLVISILGAIGYGLLWYLGAPERLVVTFAAGLAAIVIFMVINLFWKISLHTGFISGAVTVLTIVYGITAAWTVLLLPLVAWSRMEMKQHSVVQVTVGAVLVVGIVIGIFWGYGVVS